LCRRVRTQYETDIRPLKMEVDVTLDFGVAVHPQDGDQKSALLGVADQRLYQLKNSSRAAARVIPLETRPSREPSSATVQPTRETPTRTQPGATATPPSVPPRGVSMPQEPPTEIRPPAAHPEARKWERVSLAGTKAYAILTDVNQKTATVMDLSYGGVALLLEKAEEIPNQFNAVLHVPILPPVRVVLRKAYTLPASAGRARVGCAFVS
jgi:hypothetical protein